VKIAPKTTEEAAKFLNAQHSGPLKWRGMCLSLQRQARGLPAVYPSAIAAQHATPESERVRRVQDLRRGMVAYSDDPNDSNPYGHIYFIAGWFGKSKDNPDNLMTWTNDARRRGGVDMVPITFYRKNWGDNFQFGATWLNGYDFAEFNAKPKPAPERARLGDNYEHAIHDMEAAIKAHKAKGHDALVAVLERDLAHMKRVMKKYA
jgi:hypothetical protein